MSNKKKNSITKSEPKVEKLYEENGNFTGKVRETNVDPFKRKMVNEILCNLLSSMYFSCDTDAERIAVIKEFIDGTDIIYIDDSSINLDDLDDSILQTIESMSLNEVLDSSYYHAVYTANNGKDYVGSYFSLTYFTLDDDTKSTVIMNDMVDFWVYTDSEITFIFPHRNEKLNDMLREHFTSGDGKMMDTYNTRMVA